MLDGMIGAGSSAMKIRRFLGRVRMKVLRRMGLVGEKWDNALPKELQFWEHALRDRQLHLTEWKHCLDPNLPLQEDLKRLIPAAPGSVVQILDVGSGPLTYVGKRWADRDVQIVAADPLADQYNAILDRLSIRPLIRPVLAQGEKLLDRFDSDSFDLAYARNSLDHTYNPLSVIISMVAVVKPQRCVYLWHVANEGVRERYTGLHQWNLDIRHGEFIIDNGRKVQSVNEALSGTAEISCRFETCGEDQIVVAEVRKLKKTNSV